MEMAGLCPGYFLGVPMLTPKSKAVVIITLAWMMDSAHCGVRREL
jgi:hypothetical protein